VRWAGGWRFYSATAGMGSAGLRTWMRLWRFLLALHMSMAESPAAFFSEASAPLATSLATASAAPTEQAYMSAVQPSPSTAFRSTFFSISCGKKHGGAWAGGGMRGIGHWGHEVTRGDEERVLSGISRSVPPSSSYPVDVVTPNSANNVYTVIERKKYVNNYYCQTVQYLLCNGKKAKCAAWVFLSVL